MFSKFSKFAVGASLGLIGIASATASALAAPFTVSTSTLAAQNGGYLNQVYDYITSTLGDAGVFLFGVVLVLIAVVVHFAWRKLRQVFG